jgi:hypothetical protein
MEQSSLKYYKESGIAPIPNLILSFLICSIIVTIVSYYYSLLIAYMPFVYLNVFIVILFGYYIALASHYFLTLFKIRNSKTLIPFAIAISLVGMYGQWISYLFIISNPNVDLFPNVAHFLDYFIRPQYLLVNMSYLLDEGAWELFGAVFKGSTLGIIWLCEFVLILTTAFFGVKNKKMKPFSETANSWYQKQTLDIEFETINLRKQFIEEYAKNPVKAIESLHRGDGFRYTQIHIYKTRNDTKSLVSMEHVLMTNPEKGTKEKEEIIAPHYVENAYVNQLIEKYDLRKMDVFDFFYNIYSS